MQGNSYNQQRVRTAVFAPHSNIWWGVNCSAESLMSRRTGSAVNIRGGKFLPETNPIRGDPKRKRYRNAGSDKSPNSNQAAGSGRVKRLKSYKATSNIYSFPCSTYSNAASERERLFFAAFFSRKESAFPPFQLKSRIIRTSA